MSDGTSIIGSVSLADLFPGFAFITGGLAPVSDLASSDTSVSNVVTGTLSQTQKAALVTDEADSLTDAGANADDALQQAYDDVTTVLTQAGADPSQTPSWFDSIETILMWALGIGIAFFLIQALLLGKQVREAL